MTTLSTFLSSSQWGESKRNSLQRRRSGADRQLERRSFAFPQQDVFARQRNAAKLAGFGIFDLDYETGNMYWSPELRAIAGLPPSDAPLSRETVESLVHPDDRKRFVWHVETSLDPYHRPAGLDVEFRLLRPDGTVRWVKAIGNTYFIGDGEARRPFMASGFVMDITARRSAS